MALYTIQFVDSIAASPAVRLDLNSGPLRFDHEGLDLSPAPLRRVVASSQLTDGDLITSSSWGNRTLIIPVQLVGTTADGAATQIQALARELARERNIVKVQIGTQPYFFRTFAAPDYQITLKRMFVESGRVVLQIPAEPFAYGPEEVLPTVTVYNDPLEGATLNANPYFEVDASSWGSTNGATVARNTTQFHEGVASLIVTPDGVTSTPQGRSEEIPVTVGTAYRAASWVRATNAMTVELGIAWFNSSHVLISNSTQSLALSAGTWTFMHMEAAAPAGAAFGRILTQATGVVPAANQWRLDEARFVQSGTTGGMCFDLANIKGDVDTPLFLQFGPELFNTTLRQSIIAVRHRGNPALQPFVLQLELYGTLTDTTLPGNDAAMSGPGNNYVRVSFATSNNPVMRTNVATWPPTPGQDVRGQYHVFLRGRKSVGADPVTAQMLWGGTSGTVTNGKTTAPAIGGRPFLMDMGLVQFPMGVDPETDGYSNVPLSVAGHCFQLYIGRPSGGTTNFDGDCLLFFPAGPEIDGEFCMITWAIDSSSSFMILDSARRMVYSVGAGGEITGTHGQMTLAGKPPSVRPGVTNRVWFAQDTGQFSTDGAVLTNTTTITPSYWPRYTYIRPVGT